MIGFPVTCVIESAAPPRASPSNLVKTIASKPTPSWNACAVRTASCPTIASTTYRTSSGEMASRIFFACSISSTSTPSRPAVSTITMLCNLSSANFKPFFATLIGSPTPFPGSGAKTGTPTL